MTRKESEMTNADVFVLPGHGKYFRAFLAVITALCAIFFIAGGVLAGLSLIASSDPANKEAMYGLGVVVALLFPAIGIFTLYVSFVNKNTRLLGTN